MPGICSYQTPPNTHNTLRNTHKQEGQPRAQCYTAEVLKAIDADPWNFAAPGGESQKQLEERAAEYVLTHALPRLRPGGPPGLIVAHGLTIKW